jgi:hypothetical protein
MYGLGLRGPLTRWGSSPAAPDPGLTTYVVTCERSSASVHQVAGSGRQAPGQGPWPGETHVRQLQLALQRPPGSASGDHGRLHPVTPGHLGRRGRLIPVSALSLHLQLKTGNRFLETMIRFSRVTSWSFLTSHARVLLRIARDPGSSVRHRGQPGHHRPQRLRHRHRPGRGWLRGGAERRAPQPLPGPGPPPAARMRHPGTRHRRSPRPPRGRRGESAADRNPTRLRPTAAERACTHLGRGPAPGEHGSGSSDQGPLMDPDTPASRPRLSRAGCLLLSKLRPLPRVWQTHNVVQLASILRPGPGGQFPWDSQAGQAPRGGGRNLRACRPGAARRPAGRPG